MSPIDLVKDDLKDFLGQLPEHLRVEVRLTGQEIVMLLDEIWIDPQNAAKIKQEIAVLMSTLDQKVALAHVKASDKLRESLTKVLTNLLIGALA